MQKIVHRKHKSMRMQIIVKTQFVGFHFWKDAPDEVAFLRNRHRHVFNVKASFDVKHEDRQLEFFIMQSKLDDILFEYRIAHQVNLGSCEMIAAYVLERFQMEGGAGDSVAVFEDDENGAVVSV